MEFKELKETLEAKLVEVEHELQMRPAPNPGANDVVPDFLRMWGQWTGKQEILRWTLYNWPQDKEKKK